MSKVIEIIDSDDDNNTPTSSTNTSSINNSENDDNQQTQSRRRRRKSILHAMSDPDMQFQTISLEDDDEEDFFINSSNSSNAPVVQSIKNGLSGYAAASRTVLKTQKIAPRLLAPKPSTNEIIDAQLQKFLNDPETVTDVYAIAEERARINYLLSLNGMPEINFNLYARSELLQLELEQRLTQRKMLNSWENRRGAVQHIED